MQILFYDWSLHMIGGGQKFNSKIIEHLSKKHQVTVLTLFPINPSEMENYYSVDLSKVTFRHFYKKEFINQNLLKILVSKRVSELSKNYDLFFNGDGQETVNPLAKHNIMYCHFFETGWYRPSKNIPDFFKLLGIYTLKLFTPNYAKDYKIYCNSNYTKIWLKKLWEVDSQVIYPPVEIPKRVSYKKDNLIISVGRISRDKDYEIVIDIFKRTIKDSSFSNYKLLICGKSDNKDYLNQLISLSQGLNIEFKTNLSDIELKKIYSKSKIFLQAKGFGIDGEKYPALLEHFGMTVIEAMSYGCIPLVLDRAGYKETVIPSVGLRFNTLEEASEKLTALLKDNSLQKRMQKKCVQHAKKFSQKRMQNQIDDLISSLKK